MTHAVAAPYRWVFAEAGSGRTSVDGVGRRTSPATAVLRALAALAVGLLQGMGILSQPPGPFRLPARVGVLGMLCAGVLGSGSGQRCRARETHTQYGQRGLACQHAMMDWAVEWQGVRDHVLGVILGHSTYPWADSTRQNRTTWTEDCKRTWKAEPSA